MNKFFKVLTVGALAAGLWTGVGAAKSEAATVTMPVGSTFLKSALYKDTFNVQDSTGKNVAAKTTLAVTPKTFTSNKNFSYATVTFVDYDKVGTKWVKYTKTATGYFFTPAKDGITYTEYTNVKKGMTYNQMVSITGETMHLDSTYKDAYSDMKNYSWEQDTLSTDTMVLFTFDYDKLTNKSFSTSEY